MRLTVSPFPLFRYSCLCYTYTRQLGSGKTARVPNEVTMIRVVVNHQLKDKKDTKAYIEVMRELTNEAMKQPGYITGETLVNTEDEW